MVTYISSDLEFILRQIKIAEAHASARSQPHRTMGRAV